MSELRSVAFDTEHAAGEAAARDGHVRQACDALKDHRDIQHNSHTSTTNLSNDLAFTAIAKPETLAGAKQGLLNFTW
jgi:hypothetical protein